MKLFHDFDGLAIRLTDERRGHILEHPEMMEMEPAIEDVVAPPVLREERFALHHKLYPLRCYTPRKWCNRSAIRRSIFTIASIFELSWVGSFSLSW